MEQSQTLMRIKITEGDQDNPLGSQKCLRLVRGLSSKNNMIMQTIVRQSLK